MFRIFILIILIIFFGFGVVIGFYNAMPVRFNYLFGEFELPLIALIVGEFLVAALLTLIVVMGRVLSLKSEVRRLKRQLRDNENELRNLRNLPLEQSPPQPLALPPRNA